MRQDEIKGTKRDRDDDQGNDEPDKKVLVIDLEVNQEDEAT